MDASGFGVIIDRAFLGGLYADLPQPINEIDYFSGVAIKGPEYDGGAAVTVFPLTSLLITPGSVDSGSVQDAIGIHVKDISVGATNNWAIKTGVGKVEFGDVVQFDGAVSGLGLDKINESTADKTFDLGAHQLNFNWHDAAPQGMDLKAFADAPTQFSGSGLDDAIISTSLDRYSGGAPGNMGSGVVEVIIDSAATPDTFKWTVDGVTQGANIAIM